MEHTPYILYEHRLFFPLLYVLGKKPSYLDAFYSSLNSHCGCGWPTTKAIVRKVIFLSQ